MEISDDLKKQLVVWRRDFHKYAEPGWTEFRTTSKIVKALQGLGWDVIYGPDVHKADTRMGVPDAETLAAARTRAVQQGADPELVEKMGEGFTGAIGILKTGKPGPVVGFRFDIDSNDLFEPTDDETHVPTKLGFASVNDGAMHGCGHDGHAAMGLGLATVLSQHKDELTGTVKIFFQPAEEGVRGAHSMVAAGWFDDVDLFVATHLMAAQGAGHICTGMDTSLASTKFYVYFEGVGAHAGADPQKGHNALLAACAATTNMMAIARHSAGASRMNIGILRAGEGRNVVPKMAYLEAECRGATSEINEYMFTRANDIISGAAQMYDVSSRVVQTGRAETFIPSPELLPYIHEAFAKVPGVTTVTDTSRGSSAGSEDASIMINRVQQHGGLATYVTTGMDTQGGHHTRNFDVDESVLQYGVEAESDIALGAAAFLKSIGR
ncbi:MAG: amidohydrolase [Ancrocorticia sp.]|jgi:aminobenzoyl-glutamate utilization protein A|nr:amidohydrolase [Ancrocorticia sp.]